MYKAKYYKRRQHRGRRAAVIASVLLLLAPAAGGTIAWLSARTDAVTNTFLPSKVSCAVTEIFDEDTGVKSAVNVVNTGDTDAYIRVRLVSYRTNEKGQHIGGVAALPEFALGENWVLLDGFYYYTLPVVPGAMPAANLADRIELTGEYKDADGGRQAIDVMAEAIQSVPSEAVGQAWGVSITEGSVTDYTAGN